MSSILPGLQKINIEQTLNAISLFESELKLWEKKLEAWNKKNEYERAFIRAAFDLYGGTHVDTAGHHIDHPSLTQYLIWHKAFQLAEGELMQLQITKFKSEVFIRKAMVEQAKNPLVNPNAGNLIAS